MFHPLNDLAADYDAAVRIQQQAIDSARSRLHTALECADFAEIKRLHSALRILYDEKDELQTRAKELKSYLKQLAVSC